MVFGFTTIVMLSLVSSTFLYNHDIMKYVLIHDLEVPPMLLTMEVSDICKTIPHPSISPTPFQGIGQLVCVAGGG